MLYGHKMIITLTYLENAKTIELKMLPFKVGWFNIEEDGGNNWIDVVSGGGSPEGSDVELTTPSEFFREAYDKIAALYNSFFLWIPTRADRIEDDDFGLNLKRIP